MIDFEQMQAAAEERARETQEAFNDALNAMATRTDARAADMMQGLRTAEGYKTEQIRERMEADIKKAQERAAEEVRAAYAAKYGPQEWNADPYTQSMKEFAAAIGHD